MQESVQQQKQGVLLKFQVKPQAESQATSRATSRRFQPSPRQVFIIQTQNPTYHKCVSTTNPVKGALSYMAGEIQKIQFYTRPLFFTSLALLIGLNFGHQVNESGQETI